jgi:hypothetical protein
MTKSLIDKAAFMMPNKVAGVVDPIRQITKGRDAVTSVGVRRGADSYVFPRHGMAVRFNGGSIRRGWVCVRPFVNTVIKVEF